MKILLLKDMPGLGHQGSICDVSDAHARNFILPKRLGRIASQADVAAQVQQQKKHIANQQQRSNQIQHDREQLTKTIIPLRGKANPTGTLFAGLRVTDIVSAAEKAGFILTDCTISPDHIKAIGRHELTITWPDKITSNMSVEVSRA
jgi:large subunit ribosomal protein L9